MGDVKECCKDKSNLERIEESNDRIVEKCRECGCRHIRFWAEPGHIGAEIKPLGGTDGKLQQV
jgi:hypothetical protein